jgi:DNA-directed RNA polymerase subunit RPC12/RpoP
MGRVRGGDEIEDLDAELASADEGDVEMAYSCEHCGAENVLRPPAGTRVVRGTDSEGGRGGRFSFDCNSCGRENRGRQVPRGHRLVKMTTAHGPRRESAVRQVFDFVYWNPEGVRAWEAARPGLSLRESWDRLYGGGR